MYAFFTSATGIVYSLYSLLLLLLLDLLQEECDRAEFGCVQHRLRHGGKLRRLSPSEHLDWQGLRRSRPAVRDGLRGELPVLHVCGSQVLPSDHGADHIRSSYRDRAGVSSVTYTALCAAQRQLSRPDRGSLCRKRDVFNSCGSVRCAPPYRQIYVVLYLYLSVGIVLASNCCTN